MKRMILALAAVAVLSTPAAARQTQERVVVTFAAGSDEVPETARARLRAFAAYARAHPQNVVVVEGHATLAESEENSPEFAVGFSQRRAANVVSYLAGEGLPPGNFLSKAFGSRRPVSGTQPDAVANQRVEVSLGEASGW